MLSQVRSGSGHRPLIASTINKVQGNTSFFAQRFCCSPQLRSPCQFSQCYQHTCQPLQIEWRDKLVAQFQCECQALLIPAAGRCYLSPLCLDPTEDMMRPGYTPAVPDLPRNGQAFL